MMFGSGDNESPVGVGGQMGMIPGLPLQLNPTGMVSGGGGGGGGGSSTHKEERVPQWSHQETRDFIAIRAELERDFTLAKRNKTLWEAVAAKMKEMGYRRSPEQCKCKWKNLVNRYKGKETSDPDNGRQCPFFDELHAIFTERAKNMQRMLRESEAGGGGTSSTQAKKKMKRPSGERSSEDLSEEDNDDEDESEEERSSSLARSGKRKAYRERPLRTTATAERSRTSGSGILEVLQDWFRQQQHMEMQWQDMMDKRAQERQLFEQEWRISMEKLERERLLLEQAWREREEQRRLREESRAEKRDALLTTLLNKLIHEDF
ncbi:trihelix transcription factor GT-3b [Cinnamomum micranthum f. kanehirae]|uniref:Trihelix transcription factor GT-3b n=1 Tax=Cinnamomum micranthum f. kanehirae TaxID=337451 RepID=A0A443NRG5_9MAGN|nr:trihelix transcription factor GT-3b [Cinnamomum micranthum f. kanehirae]